MTGGPTAPAFASKADMYSWLVKQVDALIDGMNPKLTPEANLTIGLGNVAAMCFYELNRLSNAAAPLQDLPVNWLGFYLVRAPELLVLGPFQGRPACTEIRVGKGVCGAAAGTRETQLVVDVHDFPGHIACDSASVSEIVVPIKLESGTVVGVIDVDSTLPAHFDEEDKKGLEAIAAVLVKHLRFPFAIPYAPNTTIASAVQLAPPPPTTTVGIPHMTFDVMKPDVEAKHVGDWTFKTTSLKRIVDQKELQALEKNLGISAFPEVQFPMNALHVSLKQGGSASSLPLFMFDANAVLKDAAAFYHTAMFKETVEPQLTIPVAESWQTTMYPRHDPNVDWAWRNRFFGLCGESSSNADEVLKPLEPGMRGINWNMLKNQTIPIIHFGSLDLFEDDLHDHGLLHCAVKFRVMEPGFFILFRHSVHVHKHVVWARDVRIFFEFDQQESKTPNGKPYVVVQEQFRQHRFSDAMEAVAWRGLSLDEACQRCAEVETKDYYMELPL